LSKHATAHDYDHGPTNDHDHAPFDYDGAAAYEHHHNGNGVTVYVDHDGTADGVRDDDGNGHHPAAGSGA